MAIREPSSLEKKPHIKVNINDFIFAVYYSFDWGNVHVVAMNTEAVIDTPSVLLPGTEQYDWLVRGM